MSVFLAIAVACLLAHGAHARELWGATNDTWVVDCVPGRDACGCTALEACTFVGGTPLVSDTAVHLLPPVAHVDVLAGATLLLDGVACDACAWSMAVNGSVLVRGVVWVQKHGGAAAVHVHAGGMLSIAPSGGWAAVEHATTHVHVADGGVLQCDGVLEGRDTVTLHVDDGALLNATRGCVDVAALRVCDAFEDERRAMLLLAGLFHIPTAALRSPMAWCGDTSGLWWSQCEDWHVVAVNVQDFAFPNRTVPAALLRLHHVRTLDLSGSNIASLPAALAESMPLLGEVSLDKCVHLHTLPDALWTLPRLHTLRVRRLHAEHVPARLGELRTLRHLDMSRNLYTTLPDTLCELHALEWLDVSQTSLSALPQCIGELRALRYLRATDCLLERLPDSVGNLTALTQLAVEGNNLHDLPLSFARLTALDIVHVGGNHFQSLPRGLHTSHASEINLGGNQLTSLAAQLDWPRVRHLTLSTNQLTTVPMAVTELPQLARLSMAQNLLFMGVPAELANLTQLIDLDLNNCSLSSFPEHLTSLSNLRVLDLGSNMIERVPASVVNMRALRRLDVSNNRLFALPHSIVSMWWLNEIDAFGNSLRALPEDIGTMRNLIGLTLGNNRLTALPPSIGQLEFLEILQLGSNRIRAGGLPDTLARLTSLELLNVGRNLLTRVPDVLTRLPALRTLVLSHNQVRTLPASMARMESLGTLFVADCALTSIPPFLAEMDGLFNVDFSHNDLGTLSDDIMGTLDISFFTCAACGLHTWPRVLPVTLQYLLLHDNALPSEGADVVCIPSLRSLGIENNQLEALPDCIATLPSLLNLLAADNKLTTLPHALGRVSLEVIDVSGNHLDRFPTALLDDSAPVVRSLQTLALSRNPIRRVPDHVPSFPSVFSFAMDHAQLTRFPRAVAHLKALARLDLSHNAITDIPPDVRLMQSLQTLHLDHNALHTLPDELGALRLKVLTLSHNHLSHVPATMAGKKSLQTFFASANAFGEVPAALFSCTSLQEVDLSLNALRVLPDGLAQLHRLRTLLLQGNAITATLPDWLGTFGGLEVLDLSENHIHGGLPSAWWGGLVNLRKLFLSYNALSGTVPASLSDAVLLSTIMIDNNELVSTLPAALNKMRFLTTLSLGENALTGTLPFVAGEPPLLADLRVEGNDFTAINPSLVDYTSDTLRRLSVQRNPRLRLDLGSMHSSALVDIDASHTAAAGAIAWSFFLHNDGGIIPHPHQLTVVQANLASTHTTGAFAGMPEALTQLDVSGTAVSDVQLTATLRTLRMTHMQGERNVPTLPASGGRSAPALTFVDARHAGMVGTAEFLTHAQHLTYLYATGNPRFVNGTRIVFTYYAHALAEQRGLPSFLRYGSDFVQVSDVRTGAAPTYVCPTLQSAPHRTVSVAELDPAYSNYTACRCEDGLFGVPPLCVACPDGAVCVRGATRPLARRDYWGERVACTGGVNETCVAFAHCNTLVGCQLVRGERWAFFPCATFGAGQSACRTSAANETAVDPRVMDVSDVVNGCARGYDAQSRLCTRCDSGFFKSGTECIACPAGSAVFLPIAVVLAVVLLYAAVYVSARRASVPGDARVGSAALSILVLHLQLLSLLSDLGTPLPDLLRGASETSSASVLSVPALECVVNGVHFETRLYMALLTPVVIAVVALLAAGVTRVLPSGAASAERWRDTNVSVLVLMLTIAYMPVCLFSFKALPCSEYGGEQFMTHAPDVRCNSAAHGRMVGVAVVALIMFVLGGPAALLWRIYREHAAPSASFLRRYGRLFRVYKPALWYWKSVYYVRAVAVTMALALSDAQSSGLASSVFCVLLVFTVVQQQYAPFGDERDNTLQYLSLSLTLANFYVALAFFAYGERGSGAVVLDVLVGGVNLVLVLYLLSLVAGRWGRRTLRMANKLLGRSGKPSASTELSYHKFDAE